MRSYLLSALTRTAERMTSAEFEKSHAEGWLVWEPGAWSPPREGTMVVKAQTAFPMGPKSAGDALALALDAKDAKNGQLVLGRGTDAQLAVNDATVSSVHLIFQESRGAWTVSDAGSTNGSLYNNQKLLKGVPYPLRSGDTLVAGRVKLTFYSPKGLYERVTRKV